MRRESSYRRSMSASSTSPITRRRRPRIIISASASSGRGPRPYGRLIDGMQGTKGQIRVGGDSGAGELREAHRRRLRSRSSRAITVGPDGSAERGSTSPLCRHGQGDGRRLEQGERRHASEDVIVRDPVVDRHAAAFLLLGDKSTIRLDLDNVDGLTGNYQVAVSGDGPFNLSQANKTISLDAKKARRPLPPRRGQGRGRRRGDGERHRARRLCARASIRAASEAIDADPRAQHGEAARAATDAHSERRAVRRPRSWHRQARAFGDAVAALDVASLLQALDRIRWAAPSRS